MSAGASIIASDIPAFRAVLDNGAYGCHFANENPQSLADVVCHELADPQSRTKRAQAGSKAAWRYDWSTVASQILTVYETALATAELKVGQ